MLFTTKIGVYRWGILRGCKFCVFPLEEIRKILLIFLDLMKFLFRKTTHRLIYNNLKIYTKLRNIFLNNKHI